MLWAITRIKPDMVVIATSKFSLINKADIRPAIPINAKDIGKILLCLRNAGGKAYIPTIKIITNKIGWTYSSERVMYATEPMPP